MREDRFLRTAVEAAGKGRIDALRFVHYAALAVFVSPSDERVFRREMEGLDGEEADRKMCELWAKTSPDSTSGEAEYLLGQLRRQLRAGLLELYAFGERLGAGGEAPCPPLERLAYDSDGEAEVLIGRRDGRAADTDLQQSKTSTFPREKDGYLVVPSP